MLRRKLTTLTEALKVIAQVIAHFASHDRSLGSNCTVTDCVFVVPVLPPQPFRAEIREIPLNELAENVGCPECGTEYSIVPRYALVSRAGDPWCWANGHVVTGSLEEIDLMIKKDHPTAHAKELLSLRGRTAVLRKSYARSAN